jgi:Baseplate J-like protein
MTYLDPQISADDAALAEEILAAIADRIPGWEPSEGSPETALSEAVAIAIATGVIELQATAQQAYTAFGELILGIAKIPAGAATTTVTVTLTTEQTATGLTIAAGTQIDAVRPDGTQVPLLAALDATIAPAAGTLAGIDVVAVETGPGANGAAGTATCQLAGVSTITLDAPTAGGRDAETDPAYASRLAARTPRLRALPITPADYAAFSTDVPGVARVVAINRYNPSTPSTDAPGHLTLVGVDDTGGTLTPDIKTALSGYLTASERPLSIILHIEDADYVQIAPTVSIRLAQTGIDDFGQPTLADPDTTTADAEAAIAALLDPAQFDADPNAPGGWTRTPRRVLSIYDIAGAIDDLSGIAQVDSVHLTGGTVTNGTVIALPAPLTLPTAGSIIVTVAS